MGTFVLEMAAELKRVGRLRRLLEPLGVLYEKTVLAACREPFEVSLSCQQDMDYISENDPNAGTIHIINGESLQAAYEIWQQYDRLEKELLEQRQAAEQSPNVLHFLSPPERTWLTWFYSLSEEDQMIVELCGEKDLSVTPANFKQMKKNLIEND